MTQFELSVILSGLLYILTPGPVFLSILTLVAERGRFMAVRFLTGSWLGTSFWLVFTTASIIEASRLPPVILTTLSSACGIYLCWLAYKMLQNARKPGSVIIFKRPTLDGLTLGFLNPKSYPVMLSVFSALLLGQHETMTWENFPKFYLLAVSGMIMAYGFLITLFGFKVFKRFYLRFSVPITYLFSILYLGFGLNLLVNAFKAQKVKI